MGIFNLFKKKENNNHLATILGLSYISLDTFQTICKPTNKKGLFEVLMFNVFYCWTYYNERELINPNNSMINKKILYLHEKASEFGISIGQEDFIKLYQNRFIHFEKEFMLFNKSDFPRTKQYLPAYIFSVIYYEQLKFTPDLSELMNAKKQKEYSDDVVGMNKFFELSDFTGNFQSYLNTIFEVLENPE